MPMKMPKVDILSLKDLSIRFATQDKAGFIDLSKVNECRWLWRDCREIDLI